MTIKKMFFALSSLTLSISFAQQGPIAQAAATVVKTTTSAPVLQSWMNSDVGTAWSQGYKGQGANVIFVDDYTSNSKLTGSWDGTKKTQLHGEFTRDETKMIAPSANVSTVDFNTTKALTFGAGLNIVNASYALLAPPSANMTTTSLGGLHNSIVTAAKNGTAIISKAAGNYSVAVNGQSGKYVDYLNMQLKGGKTTIFVGALDKNGSTTAKATLASYSNYAGSDATIQKQFIVVGVEGSKTGLYGTSFAAPIISGYAAILGSKFTTANATQITNQLLNTARTDTINNYSAEKYGRGEASLSRALAPVSIK